MKERPVIFNSEMVRAIHPKMQDWNESRKIPIDDELVKRMFHSGMTAKEIAPHFNCSKHPINQAMKRLGLRREAKRRPGVGSGSGNPAWKGGRRTRSDGYIAIWTEDGERLEHQVVMEKHIGRKLVSGEVVHHRDRNKKNNEITNLELMTQSEHAKIHAMEMHSARYEK
ncbi:TPA: HNH endonuclease signature motif containing protein [Serratia marcescens]